MKTTHFADHTDVRLLRAIDRVIEATEEAKQARDNLTRLLTERKDKAEDE